MIDGAELEGMPDEQRRMTDFINIRRNVSYARRVPVERAHGHALSSYRHSGGGFVLLWMDLIPCCN